MNPTTDVASLIRNSLAAVTTLCATSLRRRFSFIAALRSSAYAASSLNAALLHQNSLGALDDLALVERLAGAVELVAQLVEGVEAADGHVEHRLDALLLQSVDDVRADAGIDRRLDHVGVGAVDEHRDRPPHAARHLEHLLQHVAVGILQVDEDHVRDRPRRCAA